MDDDSVKKSLPKKAVVVCLRDHQILALRMRQASSGSVKNLLPSIELESEKGARDLAIQQAFEDTGYTIALSKTPTKVEHFDKWRDRQIPYLSLLYRGKLDFETRISSPLPSSVEAIVWIDLGMIDSAFDYDQAFMNALKGLLGI